MHTEPTPNDAKRHDEQPPYRRLIAPPIIPIADFNPYDYIDDETG